MKTEQFNTVDNLVSGNVEAAKILSKYGIDFCTEGNRSLREACAETGIPIRKLLREISQAVECRERHTDPTTISVDELTVYIENYHHNFTTENIVFIRTSLSRLVRLHGRKYPELVEIKNIFDEMTGPLMVHMQHEEFIVFPYIRELAKRGKKVKSSIYRSANSPISGMLTDHEKGTEYLRKLKDLTHHFSPPAEGNAFQVTYAAMRELEKDLVEHLSLESEVLFPKALEMEIRLNTGHWVQKDSSLHHSL